MAARATTWLSGLAADTGLSGMAANTKTWLSGLAAVKHGCQEQHGPNFFSRNLPTALVLLRATALYLQEVQAAYGVSRVSQNYCAIKCRPNSDGVLLLEARDAAPNRS